MKTTFRSALVAAVAVIGFTTAVSAQTKMGDTTKMAKSKMEKSKMGKMDKMSKDKPSKMSHDKMSKMKTDKMSHGKMKKDTSKM